MNVFSPTFILLVQLNYECSSRTKYMHTRNLYVQNQTAARQPVLCDRRPHL